MALEKTSRAVIRSARLNPINSPEAKALEIIYKLEAKGYNFKQIAVDAILRAEGITPEMFTRDSEAQHTAELSQQLVKEALSEFMEKLKQDGVLISSGHSKHEDDPNGDEGSGLDAFSNNFARSFLQRQQSATGVDNDDDGY